VLPPVSLPAPVLLSPPVVLVVLVVPTPVVPVSLPVSLVSTPPVLAVLPVLSGPLVDVPDCAPLDPSLSPVVLAGSTVVVGVVVGVVAKPVPVASVVAASDVCPATLTDAPSFEPLQAESVMVVRSVSRARGARMGPLIRRRARPRKRSRTRIPPNCEHSAA